MKVVALVSGGKDSCYAMMRCVDYGHEIVALANLMPMDDEVDELDSYMYQTVGHQILVKYAECMGLPLFRRRIRGSMRHQHLSYKMTSGDEVEDMFLLLKEVKQKIPCITAVSSGAIASDYQRLRVENVCSRLGLVSLSYLWKQDQTLLLDEMIRKGIVALTVKVAAMGLNPREHLGKHLTDLHDLLLQLKEQYGINVCGEGGEYETLTLDCPLFTNARIVLDEYQIVMHSVDSIAPAGVLHPLSFHLERKENSAATVNEKHDNKSMEAVSVCEVDGDSNPSQVIKHSSVDTTLKSCASKVKKLHISTTKSTFSLSSWNQSPLSKGLEENLSANLKKVESQLDEYGYGWENVLYIHLYISDMNGFALANEVYLRFITENRCFFGVPSRSCIELPLVHAGLGDSYVEVLVATDYSKKVLHVQSVSCWAPSCIGPYSQATLHKEILYMAGQLGLDPPTMNLCTGGPVAQVQKALENCAAVIRSFNSSILSGMLFVIYCSSSLTSTELCDVQCATENFLTEQASEARHEKLSNVHAPIFLYVLAPALPKSADVEVKPLLYIPESSEDSTPPNIPEDGPTLKIPSAWDFGFLQLPDSCNQKFIVPGKICTSVIFITSSIASQICSISPQTLDLSCYKLEKHIKRISEFCVYLFHRTLVEHGFSWLELMNLRVYFTISHVTIEALRNAFHETFLELADINSGIPRADDDSLFSLLPVLNSGRNANMGDLVTCELVASKL